MPLFFFFLVADILPHYFLRTFTDTANEIAEAPEIRLPITVLIFGRGNVQCVKAENHKNDMKFKFVCERIKKTEISAGGYKDDRKNLSRWINGF